MCYFKDQSTGVFPIDVRYLLVCKKHFDPKKPDLAEKGDGCAHLIIKCLFESIRFDFFCENAPHSRKTQRLFFLDIISTTLLVNISQPIFLCEPGLCFSTVKNEFNKKTPFFDHFSRQPSL